MTRFLQAMAIFGLMLGFTNPASALSTWDFTGSGAGFPSLTSVDFIANDGSVITVDAFTIVGTAGNATLTTPNVVTQNANGLGVGILSPDLDATPSSNIFICGIICQIFGTNGTNITLPGAVDVLRLSLASPGWFAKEIAISSFGDTESVQLFGGHLGDGSDAILLNQVIGDDLNDPDVFALNDSNPFEFFYIASLAIESGACQGQTGPCGSPTSVRIAGFSGVAVPEPGALALLGFGLIGLMGMRRHG